MFAEKIIVKFVTNSNKGILPLLDQSKDGIGLDHSLILGESNARPFVAILGGDGEHNLVLVVEELPGSSIVASSLVAPRWEFPFTFAGCGRKRVLQR